MGVPIPPEMPKSGERRSCCAAVVVVGVILAVLASLTTIAARKVAERSRQEFEQRQAERRVEKFNRIKRGEDGSRITIMDPLLLEMLAGDADCVAHLTSLHFGMVDLSGPPAAAASSLVNVKKLTFYDCGGAGDVLRALQGSPAIEDVLFEMAIDSEIITSLSSLPHLKKVEVYGYRVSSEQEALLRQKLPNVEIVIDDG